MAQGGRDKAVRGAVGAVLPPYLRLGILLLLLLHDVDGMLLVGMLLGVIVAVGLLRVHAADAATARAAPCHHIETLAIFFQTGALPTLAPKRAHRGRRPPPERRPPPAIYMRVDRPHSPHAAKLGVERFRVPLQDHHHGRPLGSLVGQAVRVRAIQAPTDLWVWKTNRLSRFPIEKREGKFQWRT